MGEDLVIGDSAIGIVSSVGIHKILPPLPPCHSTSFDSSANLPVAIGMWGNQVKVAKLILAGIAAASLSACAPTREEYQTQQTIFQGSPKIKASFIEKCSKSQRFMGDQEILSQLMNVPKSQVRGVFCRRFAESMASGRLTYDDFRNGLNHSPSPTVIKILQGR